MAVYYFSTFILDIISAFSSSFQELDILFVVWKISRLIELEFSVK
jgi:hypothetical protein